jgi:hypothetical protein
VTHIGQECRLCSARRFCLLLRTAKLSDVLRPLALQEQPALPTDDQAVQGITGNVRGEYVHRHSINQFQLAGAQERGEHCTTDVVTGKKDGAPRAQPHEAEDHDGYQH